jgi:uncharacterized protein
VTGLLAPQGPGIPVPVPGLASRPYWDAARQGRLVFQRCQRCERIPPRPALVCAGCGGELAWQESCGRGSLYSWTVVWRPQHPSFRTPYAPAVVRVEEGWWLLTAVVGCQPDDLSEGMPVRIEFHHAGDDIWLPYAAVLGSGP